MSSTGESGQSRPGGGGAQAEVGTAQDDNLPSKKNRGFLWILLLPYIALLWLPFYNHSMPSLAGFPFFYWYQFLWVPLTSLLIYIVYKVVR